MIRRCFFSPTFIHELGGFETIDLGLALFRQLALPRLSQPRYAHLQTTEGAGVTVLLTSRGQDLSSNAVQCLAEDAERLLKRKKPLIELHINPFLLSET